MTRSWWHRRFPGSTPSVRERGAVGGVEVLPFGVLIFVVGALMIANAWSVIDVKMATTAAAREAARSYVEADSTAAASAAARTAGRDAIESYGRDPQQLDLHAEAGAALIRCTRITYTAEYEVPALTLPFGIGFGGAITVRSRHSEVVDPLRDRIGPENRCGY